MRTCIFGTKLFACLFVSLIGCNRAAPVATKAPIASPSVLEPAADEVPATTPNERSTGDEQTAALQDSSRSKLSAAIESDSSKPDVTESEMTAKQESPDSAPPTIAAAADEEPKLPPAERIMLLTPSGPLLVDLHITINGKPYRDSFESVVEDVMAIADDDKDGVVTWENIMNHPRFSAGQFGNPVTASYQAQRTMVRLYDTTKNGRVDSDELVRYLTSNQSSSQALTLYTSSYRRMQNRDDSPIRKWLDVNDDLVLDESEIAGASRRLRLRDTNDDEILFPSDFVDASGRQNAMTRRRSRDSEYLPKVGWQVKDNEPWSDMRVAWNHFYSVDRYVRADDLVIGDEMYRQLDIDRNDLLDNIEMEMLAEVEAHIVLTIELAAKAATETPDIKLAALRLPTEELHSVVQHQPNRITIALPEMSLDIFASDRIGYEGYDQQATQFLQQGDADKNDYLSKDEFASVAGPLNVEYDAVDVDGNEMVFQDEIVMVLQQRNIINRNQIAVRADDQDDALLPSLDLNSDGRVDSREISQVADALLTLDQNEDGQVQLHEIRGSMMLGVVRGGGRGQIVQGDSTFAVPAVVRKPSESTPRWFNGMDRNRDDGISWREFLGSRRQFDELDADADGFVVVEEATAK